MMSALGINSNESNPMHGIEVMAGYLFQVWFALRKKGHESYRTIIMDIVREKLLKSYFGESEHYIAISGHIIARINEYVEIFEEKTGRDAGIEFGTRFYCYVVEQEKIKPARKTEAKELLDMFKIDAAKALKAYLYLIAFREFVEKLLDDFKVSSLL
jgi:hypothetical protein